MIRWNIHLSGRFYSSHAGIFTTFFFSKTEQVAARKSVIVKSDCPQDPAGKSSYSHYCCESKRLPAAVGAECMPSCQ